MQFHHHGYVSGDPRIQPAAGVGLDRPEELPDEVRQAGQHTGDERPGRGRNVGEVGPVGGETEDAGALFSERRVLNLPHRTAGLGEALA